MSRKYEKSFTNMFNLRNYTQKSWITLILFVLGILIAVLLPDKSNLKIIGFLQTILLVLIYITWAVLIISDPLMKNFVKNIVAFGFFALIIFLFVKYSNARWGQLRHVFFNFEIMNKSDPMGTGSKVTNWTLMGSAFFTTIKIFLISAVLATFFGLFLAIMRKVVNDKILNFVIIIFVDFCRSVPMLVFLMIVYSALPYTGIVLSPEASGILTMSVVEGAFLSETFRAGINSIHAVQTEAARSLGLSGWQTMRLVVLPQAVKVIIPPYTSSLVGIMKGTALCSTITIYEMIKMAQQIQTLYGNPSSLIVATLAYLILLLPLSKFSSMVEHRLRGRSV